MNRFSNSLLDFPTIFKTNIIIQDAGFNSNVLNAFFIIKTFYDSQCIIHCIHSAWTTFLSIFSFLFHSFTFTFTSTFSVRSSLYTQKWTKGIFDFVSKTTNQHVSQHKKQESLCVNGSLFPSLRFFNFSFIISPFIKNAFNTVGMVNNNLGCAKIIIMIPIEMWSENRKQHTKYYKINRIRLLIVAPSEAKKWKIKWKNNIVQGRIANIQ